MSVPSSGGGGDFRVGDVLSRAWTIFTNNLLFFLGTSALMYGVMIAFLFVFIMLIVGIGIAGGMVQGGSPGAGVVVLLVLLVIVAMLAVLVIAMVGQAAMLFGAFQYLRGLPVRMGESLSRAMGRIGPLVGTTLLVWICVGFALLALVVPGIILFCIWAVAIPVCVVEGSGPTASVSRSAALTKGHRWKVFGIFLILWGISVVAQIIQMILAQASSVLASLYSLGMSVTLAAFAHCVVIMIYHDLRVAKEGIDTTQIASVFD